MDSTGDCSLREAIVSANQDGPSDGCTAGSGVDTIELPADVGSVPDRGVYVLDETGTEQGNATAGDLDLNQEVIIVGVTTAGGSTAAPDDVVVRAGSGFSDRAFNVHSPAQGSNFAVAGLTVRGFDTGSDVGAAFRTEGAAALVLRKVQIIDNTSGAGGVRCGLTRTALAGWGC